MTDYAGGIGNPATHCFVVVPDDDNDLPEQPQAIRAVGSGTITFRARDSAADIAHPVLDGERIDCIVRAVRVTGTDVTVIGYA